MIVGFVLELAVGGLCAALGLLLWLKRKLSILHDYHYRNVKQEDIPAYTRQVGVGLLLLGAGILVTGFFHLACSPHWWIPLALGFVLGLSLIFAAQKTYNGSV